MKKIARLQKLQEAGVIAVVRADSATQALDTVDAIVAGGMLGLELTFTIPDATTVIAQTVQKYQDTPGVIIGAGTVLDAATARIAILAGAEYIVSPTFDAETAKMCHVYQVPYLPGCMTLNEMKQAVEAGVDIVKLFPGSAFGPDYVKAVKAPFPDMNIMPTGGVNLDNLADWFEAGCVSVGVGGNLLKAAAYGAYDEVTAEAAKYVAALAAVRGV